jgi:hypothetical protein
MKRRSVNDAIVQKAQRLNVRISPEAYERLLIHAIKARLSPGDLVTSLIDRHCRDWRVQSNRGQSQGSAESTVEVESPEATAA